MYVATKKLVFISTLYVNTKLVYSKASNVFKISTMIYMLINNTS